MLVAQRRLLHVNYDITVDILRVAGAERFIQEPTALALTLFIEEAVLTLNVFAELGLPYGHNGDRHVLGR